VRYLTRIFSQQNSTLRAFASIYSFKAKILKIFDHQENINKDELGLQTSCVILVRGALIESHEKCARNDKWKILGTGTHFIFDQSPYYV